MTNIDSPHAIESGFCFKFVLKRVKMNTYFFSAISSIQVVTFDKRGFYVHDVEKLSEATSFYEKPLDIMWE